MHLDTRPHDAYFFNCFRSTLGRKKRGPVTGLSWQSRSHSACLPIMAASTSWRLAGSKYFNPSSRGSVTQWRHVLMGLVGLATEVCIYIYRERPEARSVVPTHHVSCQDVPRQHTSRNSRGRSTLGSTATPLHNPDIYRYLLRHLRDEARIKR